MSDLAGDLRDGPMRLNLDLDAYLVVNRCLPLRNFQLRFWEALLERFSLSLGLKLLKLSLCLFKGNSFFFELDPFLFLFNRVRF